jgi:hypothetical protein
MDKDHNRKNWGRDKVERNGKVTERKEPKLKEKHMNRNTAKALKIFE